MSRSPTQSVAVNSLSPRSSFPVPGSPGIGRAGSTSLTPAGLASPQSLSAARPVAEEDERVTPYTVVFSFQGQRPVIASIRLGMATDPERERMFFVSGGPQRRGRQAVLAIEFGRMDIHSLYNYGRVYRDRDGMLAEFRNPDFQSRHSTPVSLYADEHNEAQFQQVLATGYDPSTGLLIQDVTFP